MLSRLCRRKKEKRCVSIYLKCVDVINSCITSNQIIIAGKYLIVAERYLTLSQRSVLYDCLFDKQLEIIIARVDNGIKEV